MQMTAHDAHDAYGLDASRCMMTTHGACAECSLAASKAQKQATDKYALFDCGYVPTHCCAACEFLTFEYASIECVFVPTHCCAARELLIFKYAFFYAAMYPHIVVLRVNVWCSLAGRRLALAGPFVP
eukprot:664682-Pelagomonas_calceolata.AAC.1